MIAPQMVALRAGKRRSPACDLGLLLASLCFAVYAAGCTSATSTSSSGRAIGAKPKGKVEKTSASSGKDDDSKREPGGAQQGDADASGAGSALGEDPGAGGRNDDSRQTLEDQKAPSKSEVDALVSGSGDAGLYVSVAHLGEGRSALDLEVYRYGLTKALNSVSTNPEIVKLEAIDSAETVYRFVPADFRLSDADIQLILASPGGDRSVRKVGSSKIIDGDWLVYAITRPEIYDVIMRIPNSVNELEAQAGVDMSRAISAEVGDNESEVTFARRTLIRTPIDVGGEPGGYYWRSIDYFGALTAGEFFFSLPNGLQGYMLSGFVGQHRIDAQPFVATDRNRAQDGLTQCVGGEAPCGYVINGESCITCHANGIKMSARFGGVQGGTTQEFEALVAQDSDRFAAALAKMGFDSVGVEPVLETLKVYRAASQTPDKRRDGGEIVPVNPDKGIFQR